MSHILSSDSFSEREEINLTRAERAVVFLICDGFRNKEIAGKLGITEKTVKSHCNRIYKKFGVTDRLQLAIHVYKAQPGWYVSRYRS